MFRDNCDSFLKYRIFNVDPWGVLWVKRKYDKFIAEKCVEDASEYIWLRWEARSFLIGKSQSVKMNCFPR